MKTQSSDTSPGMKKWNDDVAGCEYRIADLSEREARIRHAFLPAGVKFDTPQYWQYLRGQTKSERIVDGLKMTEMFFDEVRAEIRDEHLDWSEREHKVEFVKRMYGPTLAGCYQRYLEQREKINGNSD